MVPAGTVGGSVSKTAKVAPAVGTIGAVLVKFANKEIVIMAIAVVTAARPYLKVHLRYISFLCILENWRKLKSTHFKVY